MIKLLVLASLLNSALSIDYVNVEAIYHYQTNGEKKEIIFDFGSDFYSTHTLNISMDLYDFDNNYIRTYKNNIDIIGNKTAKANLNYSEVDEFYLLIDVYYKDTLILSEAKVNFYVQDGCDLDLSNFECNRIYKSEYREGINKDLYTNFRIKNNLFNKYLSYNSLKLEELNFYSDYNFSNSNSYLIIEDYISEYELIYDDGYKFILMVEGENKYQFKLLENYYINLLDFKLREEYFDGSLKTNEIYFPFTKDYREYHCLLVIEDFIDIRVSFSVFTSDILLGECADSKFCLARRQYD